MNHRSSHAGRWLVAVLALAIVSGSVIGCQKKEEQNVSTSSESTNPAAPSSTSAAPPAATETLPAGHIEVQHVLIGFQGSVRGKPITRTQEEANKLAHDILNRAKAGEDFGGLVKQYTDDQYPGIYRMADRGVQPGQDEFPRDGMVASFGNAAFSLKVGEVGISEYDKTASPFGWHIIKRLR